MQCLPQRSSLVEIRTEFRRRGEEARRRLNKLVEKNFPRLLPCLPIWATTNLSVHNRVPFRAGAFDVVIIDEAAQCDVASVIPLLFRAKRAVYVGDPKQLPPIGGIGSGREDELRRRHGLDDVSHSRLASAGRSAWDVAHDALIVSGQQPLMLSVHYRCHPQIAAFFSHEFYGGGLRVRTDAAPGPGGRSGIRWTHVDGGSQTVQGSRWHEPQLQAIVAELDGLRERGFQGSVGVVTPFREHAKRIRDEAYRRIGPGVLEKWEFVSETADGFQGGEKDLILFGLVGGPRAEDTPRFYERELNRFNVAVSRAKSLLHIFGDKNWAQASGIRVVEALLRAVVKEEAKPSREVRKELIGPVWEPALAEALSAAGLEYRQQYPACGFYLDFALFRADGHKLDLEVDGERFHRDNMGTLGRRHATRRDPSR